MAIYYALFENKIKELSEAIQTLELEDALEKLAEAEQETKTIFHAQTAEEAIDRAKAQMWAYNKIISCYKELFELPDNNPKKTARMPDLTKKVTDFAKEWEKVTNDSITGDSFYKNTQDELKEIIDTTRKHVQLDAKEKATYKTLAANLHKTLETCTSMLAALKKEYDFISDLFEKKETEHDEETETILEELEEKTEIEERILDEFG